MRNETERPVAEVVREVASNSISRLNKEICFLKFGAQIEKDTKVREVLVQTIKSLEQNVKQLETIS